jgi:RimJ/RimL family protein N-acetyltransferase
MTAPVIEFVVFKPRHLAALRLQAVQAAAQPLMNEALGQEIEAAGGRAFTMLLDGQPIACAGAYEIAPGRAYLWSYLGAEALRHFKALHRYAFKVIGQLPWRRVEAYSDVRQIAGARWLLRLGFQFEGVARAWSPDGRDMRQFARIRHGLG